jgi:hypothetical protein
MKYLNSMNLYVFVDESGNFDFSAKGTKVFVLTFLSTTNPNIIASCLSAMRYSLLPGYACGQKMEESGHFHATEDLQAVRNQVFSSLAAMTNIRVDAVIAQKNKANPIFHSKNDDFYKLLAKAGLKYVLNRVSWSGYQHVVFVFSSLFDKKKRGLIKQTFKSYLKTETQVPFSFYFHPAQCDYGNQAADYFGWAVYRKWENTDLRSYNLIQNLIKSEFSIFDKGTNTYY